MCLANADVDRFVFEGPYHLEIGSRLIPEARWFGWRPKRARRYLARSAPCSMARSLRSSTRRTNAASMNTVGKLPFEVWRQARVDGVIRNLSRWDRSDGPPHRGSGSCTDRGDRRAIQRAGLRLWGARSVGRRRPNSSSGPKGLRYERTRDWRTHVDHDRAAACRALRASRRSSTGVAAMPCTTIDIRIVITATAHTWLARGKVSSFTAWAR